MAIAILVHSVEAFKALEKQHMGNPSPRLKDKEIEEIMDHYCWRPHAGGPITSMDAIYNEISIFNTYEELVKEFRSTLEKCFYEEEYNCSDYECEVIDCIQIELDLKVGCPEGRYIVYPNWFEDV